jgi:hypothetical protein
MVLIKNNIIAIWTVTLTIVMLMAAPVQAEVTRIVISDMDCKRLLLKQASKSADYVPGVDAKGRKVKSADLPDANRIVIPDELSFDISPKIYQMMGATPPTGLEDTAVKVGTVTVKKSGGIYFNGKRLNSRTRKELTKLCQQQRDRAAKK